MCIVCEYNPTIGLGGLHQSGEDNSMVPVPESAQDNVFDYGATGYTYSSTQSSDQNINGVLSGNSWTDTDISFGFTDGNDDYSYTTTGASELSTQQKNSVLYWLDNAEAVTLLSFEEYAAADGSLDSPAEATLKFGNTTENTTAYAYYPNNSSISGDSWFGNSGDNPTLGNYDHTTVGHEIGHALGLSHGHQDSNGFGAMETNFDAMEYSIMTYRSFINGPTSGYTNGSTSYAQTLMMYDIAALQYMYGADFTTNASDSTYTVNLASGEMLINGVSQDDPSGNKIFRTVWDGNGNDTYDFSNLTNDLQIDLTPGSYVDLDATGNDNRASLGSGNYASGHIYNAIQYQGDTRSLIENAIGGSGDDEIIGNAADNTLEGGAGNDTLSGAAGSDVFKFDLNTGNDIVVDFQQGYDNVSFGAVDINDLTFDYNGINTTVNYDSGDGSWFASIVFNNIAWQQYSDINTIGGDNWLGTSADETRVGTSFSDTLEGAGGSDTMTGGDGFDFVSYSTSTSGVSVNLSNGSVSGGHATGDIYVDTFEGIIGSDYSDVLRGTDDDNKIVGGGSSDTILGFGGNDTLEGGSGSDRIIGDDGNDFIYGGSDRDFIFSGNGADYIDGGEGSDRVIYTTSTAINVNLTTGVGSGGWAEGDVFTSIEMISGSDFGDTIVGNDAINTLDGFGGNDIIYGGDGKDRITGSEGEDSLYGGQGADYLNAGTGNDYLEGGDNSDQLGGSSGNDEIWGQAGGDKLYGSFGNDTLYGGDQADLLFGGDGADMIFGGTGSDRILFSGSAAVQVDLLNGTGTGGMAEGDTYDSIEKVTGSGFGDTIWGDTVSETFIGGNGEDTLYGGGAVDRLVGGNDDDYIYGGDGADYISGNNHNDTIFGGDGSDRILGDSGNDTLDGDAGDDLLFGGTGSDKFVFESSDVTLGVQQRDKVFALELGVDVISIEGFGASFATIAFSASGANTLVTVTTDFSFLIMGENLISSDLMDTINFV
jgi:serralysin